MHYAHLMFALLPPEHRPVAISFQACLFLAILSISFNIITVLLITVFIYRFRVFLDLPLFLRVSMIGHVRLYLHVVFSVCSNHLHLHLSFFLSFFFLEFLFYMSLINYITQIIFCVLFP
jgi:hypothetical protein